MKQKFTHIILLQIFFCTASFAQIPNPDFENWTLWGGWFYNPDSWTTNNNQIQSTFVSPDSDAYSGNLAMHLYNHTIIRPRAATRFAYSNNITAISAYVKLKLIFNDTVSIIVREFYNGTEVDSGMWIGTSDILNYSSIVIPVSQNNNSVDTVEIEITGGNQNNLVFEGTSFLVDDLEMNPSFIIIDDPIIGLQDIYPNPVRDVLYVPLNDIQTPMQIKIFDSRGCKVRNFSLDHIELSMLQQGYCEIKIDLNTFADGVYLLQVNASTIKNYKFIKQ